MPDIDDIERRLRLPAPDEPMFLPALELPWGEPGSRVMGAPIRAGRSSASVGAVSPRLAFAVLLMLAALIGAILSGTLRLDRLQGPLDPDRGFAARGVTIDLPDDWIRLTPDGPSDGGAATALVASSTAVDGCSAAELPAMTQGNAVSSGNEVVVPPPSGPTYSGIEDQVFACALDRPMQAGETRVALSFGLPQEIGIGPIEPFDAEAWHGPGATLGGAAFYVPSVEDGWTETIDGMPAKVVIVPGTDPTGPDEIRTWGVYDPRFFGQVWFVRFGLRGPGLDALRSKADAMAKSLRFDAKPAPLVQDDQDRLLTESIDRIDRESREFRGSRLFGCFPREAGAQQVSLTDGPGGPLIEPVDVTCTTSIEDTSLGVWHATLVVSWDATADRPAGRWGWELFFGADPSVGAQGELEGNLTTIFPGLDGEPPPPLATPLVIPKGSIVQVLPPGIDQTQGPTQALYQDPNPSISEDILVGDAQAGRRFAVTDGPVTHHGTDWYLVEAPFGTSFPMSWAWLPANDGKQPLLRVVTPECPTAPSVTDLLALVPAERVLCFGDDELTLEPVVAARAEASQGGSVDGTPGWLARDASWRLYGEGGPDGVEGALAVTIAPSAGDELPAGPWLRVRGHFADPAAATCERTFPDGWGGFAETPEMQHVQCRELFVVTEVEERSGP